MKDDYQTTTTTLDTIICHNLYFYTKYKLNQKLLDQF